MTGKKKTLVFLVFAALLLALLLSLNYLASTFINIGSVRTEIRDRFARQTGGTLEYQSIDLSLLPLVHIVINNADISLPGKMQGTAATLGIYPELLPLFRGALTIHRLQIESPALTIMLPPRSEKAEAEKEEPLADRVKNGLASAMAALASAVPDLTMVVKNGRLHIRDHDHDVAFLDNLRSTIHFPPGGLSLDMHFDSNIGHNISISVQFNQAARKGNADIALKNFSPGMVMSYLFPGQAQPVGDSEMDLAVHLLFDESGITSAEVQGSLSRLTIVRGKEKLVLKGRDMKAAYRRVSAGTEITVDDLRLDYPKVDLRGSLFVNKGTPGVRMEIGGTGMDVPSFREAALMLKDDAPVLEGIFSVIRGGRIPVISYQGQGASFHDLGNEKNFVIRGRMEKGELYVPGPELHLKEVSGNVVVADAVLKGEDLSATTDGASAKAGRLTLGLNGKDRPFHLDLYLKTDLAKLQPFLQRVVTHREFLNEIGSLHNVKGSAEGRLVLGERLHSVGVRLEVSDVDLAAEYDRLPYPLKIHRGKLLYDTSMVRVNHMRGKIGRSSFSDLDAEVTLGRDPVLKISSATSMLQMDEIHAWIISYESIRDHIKEFESLKGTMEVISLSLKGPLMKPGDWNLKGTGRVTALTITTPRLPAPLELEGGRFEVTQKRFSFTEGGMRFEDSTLSVSGVIEDYLDERATSDLTFRGESGPKATEWVTRLINMPEEFEPRSPLSISDAHFIRERDGTTSFTGGLTLPKGPVLSVNAEGTSAGIMIRELTVKDRESQASMAFTLNDREMNIDFTGTLVPRTMKSLFINPTMQGQKIEGDFHARIKRGVPLQFSAQGNLNGEHFFLPLSQDVPSRIESFSLEAGGNEATIKNAALMLADRHITLKGTATSSEKGVRLALDASADGIEWDRLSKAFDKDLDEEQGESFLRMIDGGTIGIDSAFFSYGSYTWSPFRGMISLSEDDIHVDVTEAELCNLSFPGIVIVDPEGLSVDIHPYAAQKQLETTIACLFNVERYMTGTFDLDGRVTGAGKQDALTDDLKGPLKFTTVSGRIYQYSLIAKVLAFLNLTEIFRGQVPDLLHEGFAYKTMTAEGEIKGSDLLLHEVVIDGASMKIVIQGVINYMNRQTDLKVLVAPLKTVDFILNKIPIVRDIFGGSLISIPVRVTGDFENPDISYMNPADIGSGLIDIMKNTLNLPGKIIKPFIPQQEKEGGGAGPSGAEVIQ